jgi:ribosomal protein S12 methylthiotransferase accessory factor YcaO
LPQEPSEVRRVERKSRAEAKRQALKQGTGTKSIDEQKSQLLPTNRERFEIKIFLRKQKI